MPEGTVNQRRPDGAGADDERDGRGVVRQLDGVVFAQEVEAAARDAQQEEEQFVAPTARPHPFVTEGKH